MRIISIYLFLFIAFSNQANSQQELPVPRNYQQAYKNETRSLTGEPGLKYWQNKASYSIAVNFSPDTRILAGSEEITYINNSPDTLKQIWFKLYPNLYQEGAQRDFSIRPEDAGQGIIIEKMAINQISLNNESWRINGTNMQLTIPPLLPGKQIQFSINYSYILNKNSHMRTGMVDDNAAFIAYFFPRIAVYDDVDGWNRIPYTGTLEFYNDFCDFDATITVPKNYIVNATGNLINASEVLMPDYVQRISTAENLDAVTRIIDTTDLIKGNITLQHPNNTWKFKAENVTDFAFATSNHYLWYASSVVVDSATLRRTRVDAVFNPEHKDFYEVVDFARKTVEAMSFTFPAWPYPYPHETIFDGLDQMEYPMMVNDNPLEERIDAIELTDHEIFHTMFPFYMGINETKYAWMDEGWATIGEWIISHIIDSTIFDDYGMNGYNMAAGSTVDLPITTLSTQTSGVAYFTNAYPKPALGYLYCRDLLGDDLFFKGLHYYIEQWNGKHPLPFDFFYCMNKGSGQNLNWFWKRWFFENGYPDLAIKSVTQKGKNCTVIIESKGNKPVPVNLTFYFKDGSTQKYHQSIACWQNNNKTFTAKVSFDKPLEKIILGEVHDADIDSSDNLYQISK